MLYSIKQINFTGIVYRLKSTIRKVPAFEWSFLPELKKIY